MIVLDTNVVSEPLRRRSTPAVVAWLDAQSIATLHLTTISLAELRYGIAALPKGRHRTTLRARVEEELLPLFAGRILSLDEPASSAYAAIRARARSRGKAIGDLDALVASIASSRSFAVATRDVAPFLAADVPVINPFGEH